MTDTKRLSLHGRLRMAAACPDPNASLLAEAADAIEQYEAFRQEVSDAVEKLSAAMLSPYVDELLARFILPKPDPLVVVLGSAPYPASSKELAAHIRADMKARGYEWRKIEEEG